MIESVIRRFKPEKEYFDYTDLGKSAEKTIGSMIDGNSGDSGKNPTATCSETLGSIHIKTGDETTWKDFNNYVIGEEYLDDTVDYNCQDLKTSLTTYTNNANSIINQLGRLRDQINSKNQTNLISKYQNQINQFNQKKLSNYDSDIMTTRRQVQISVNEFKRRENNIFILKTFFVYLLISMIPLLLSSNMGNKLIPRNISLIILFVITLLFCIIFLRNLLNSINRSLINYDLINYDAESEGGVNTQQFDNDYNIAAISLLASQLNQANEKCGVNKLTDEEVQNDMDMLNKWVASETDWLNKDQASDYAELQDLYSRIESEAKWWESYKAPKGSRYGPYDNVPQIDMLFNTFKKRVKSLMNNINSD